METPERLQPQKVFLTFKQVESLTGLSRSTIYRQVKKGEFPKPRSISTRKVAFLQIELENWIESRKEA